MLEKKVKHYFQNHDSMKYIFGSPFEPRKIFGYLFRNNPLKIAEWSVMNLMTAYHKIP